MKTSCSSSRSPCVFSANLNALRGAATFAVQFWFYGQIYALGRTGKADKGLSVFAAWRQTEATHKDWLKRRRG